MRDLICLLLVFLSLGFGWCQTDEQWLLAQSEYEQGQYEAAILTVDQYLLRRSSLSEFRKAEVLYLKANAKYYLADYLGSLDCYDQAIEYCSNDPASLNLRGMALFDRAFAEYALKEYLPAYNSTRSAEAVLSNLVSPNLDYLLSIYADLAFTAGELGFFTEAETYIQRGEQLLYQHRDQLKLPAGSARKEVTFAYERALLYASWNKEKQALDALQQLDELANKQPFNPEEQIRYAVSLNQVADMYLNNRSSYPSPVQEAHQMLDEAFMALDTTIYPSHFWQFTFNRIKAFRYAGDRNSALHLNHQLISDCPDDDERLAFFWAQRGLVYLPIDADSAHQAFLQMLSYIHLGAAPLMEDFSNFEPSTMLNHTGLLVEIADEILQRETSDPDLDALAASFYRLGLRQFLKCFDGRTFNPKLRSFYEKAVGGILRTGMPNTPSTQRQLLEHTDNVENRLAWQRFSGNRKLRQLSWPDSLYKHQLELRQAIVLAQQRNDAEQVQALQDDLRGLEQSLVTNITRVGYSDFALLDLQKNLSSQQLVLKYNRFGDQLYLFGITQKEVWIRLLEPTFDWEKEVMGYLSDLRQLKPLTESSIRLGELLLPNEIADYSELFIVPCQELANLPFHALSYKADFLIKSHAVSYAPHLVFLQKSLTPQIERESRMRLVLAPQESGKGKSQANRGEQPMAVYLQGAETEATVVAGLTSATLLAGEQGTKQALLEVAPKVDLLHIASHAVFDGTSPNLSYLQLAQGEKLFLEEVYGLSLPAEMVVLSACQTATSANYGRSVHAFHRAFFQAGVPSVVAGLWELPDQATSSIIEHFYRSLQTGTSKANALRSAQLALIEGQDMAYQHPFFWAGLVVQGDAAPIFSQHGNGSMAGKLLLALVVVFGIGWGIRKLFTRNNRQDQNL